MSKMEYAAAIVNDIHLACAGNQLILKNVILNIFAIKILVYHLYHILKTTIHEELCQKSRRQS